MIDDLRLVVGKREIAGWKAIRVTRGIERCPNDFTIMMTELYPGADVMTVTEGQACQVYLGKDLVITGYVDRVMPSLTPRAHSVTISGRGKCQDLVDCSAEWPGGQFSNATLTTIATSLADVYGIKVQAAGVSQQVFLQINFGVGEEPFEIIERICRYVATLAYEGPAGQLILSRVGRGKHAGGLKEGKNVEQAHAMFSVDQRFAQYDVFMSNFNPFRELGENGFLIHSVADPAIRRARKLAIVQASDDANAEVAIKRAEWEKARRLGRSKFVQVTTDSWRDSAGRLYEPNMLLDIDIPTVKLSKRAWLIGEVTYRRDQGGTACDLVLMPPDAFSPEPINLFPSWKELQTNG